VEEIEFQKFSWIWCSHALTAKRMFLWVVTSCSSETSRRFGGAYLLVYSSILNIFSSETSGSLRTTQRYTPEDGTDLFAAVGGTATWNSGLKPRHCCSLFTCREVQSALVHDVLLRRKSAGSLFWSCWSLGHSEVGSSLKVQVENWTKFWSLIPRRVWKTKIFKTTVHSVQYIYSKEPG
jgi:hypothetical protein